MKNARQAFADMKESLEGNVTKLQTEIKTMDEEANSKEEEIEAKLPDFREFEAFFNRSTGQYDDLKKKVVKMKNEKTSLEESVNRAKKEIAKQERPLVSSVRGGKSPVHLA